jgi:hypothetical protein
MRTQAEVAAKYKVNVRTVRRWVERGVDIQNDASISDYLANRKSAPTQPTIAQTNPQPVEAMQLPDEAFDFTTTDRLIANLAAMTGRAARDLEAARATGLGSSVARASRVFSSASYELRQALVQRDQLKASSGASYSPSEVAYAFAQIWVTLRHILSDDFPRAAEQASWDAGIIEPQHRAVLEGVIRTVVQTTVFPCFSETGAHFAAMMAGHRNTSTLKQRENLYHAVQQAWKPELPESAPTLEDGGE